MGILEQLGYSGPVAKFIGSNRNAIGNFGVGLTRGRTFGEGLSYASEGALQGRQADDAYATAEKAKADQAAQLEAAIANMRQYSPEIADLVQGAGPDAVKAGWNAVMKGMTPEAFTLEQGQTRYVNGKPVAFGGEVTPNPKDAFGFEKDLYAQYAGSDPVKVYSDVRDGYERVRASSQQQSGAGDMGLLYGIMKMYDPGSVVRESEFATAASSGDLGEQMQGLVSRILTGERLPESQRQEFLAAADALYAEAARNLGDINSQFEGRAEGWGVDANRFVRQPETYQPLTKPVSGTTSTGITFDFTPDN